jgi:predicted aldo/keto reductase-like oxidoreductase
MYGNLELNKAMDACKDAGIGLIAMKTQTSVPEDQDEVKKFVSNSFNLYQAKLKAAWADERIDACVSGISNMNVLKDNVDAAKSTVQLSMNEYMQLNQYAARTASSRCQGCNQICEAEVTGETRVADMLRYLMYAECYGDVDEARQLYARLSDEERNVTHDFRAAAKVCPQGIDIGKRLQDAVRALA